MELHPVPAGHIQAGSSSLVVVVVVALVGSLVAEIAGLAVVVVPAVEDKWKPAVELAAAVGNTLGSQGWHLHSEYLD